MSGRVRRITTLAPAVALLTMNDLAGEVLGLMTNVLFDFSPGLIKYLSCVLVSQKQNKTSRTTTRAKNSCIFSHSPSSSSCIDGYRQTKFVGGKPCNGLVAQSLHACEGGKRQPDGSIGLNVNILTE